MTSKMMLCGVEDFPTVQIGGFLLRLETDEPRPEVMEIARKELRETPELRESSIKELSALLKEEETLYSPYDHEAFLIRFLRPTKFYPKSAFELAKRYFEFKNKHKNIYDGLVPSKEPNVFSHEVINVLPKRDQFGRRILVLSLGKKWKHNKVCLDEVYKGAVLFMEAAVYEPETQICGAVVIFDMAGLSLQQTMQFTPPFAKRIVDWLQDCIPIRVKGIHIINQPYIFNMVFALFKPFLREKLKSRIYFHGTDRKSFHKHVDPSCLPEEYGGTLDIPTVPPSEWYNLMTKLEQEYEKLNSYGYKKQIKE
ncbi:alpha-tocopherol transfer protein-like isoform X2 [Cimex lectularius]|uniref:CRAL-TRIO domain-containing protein n=1 Tax=Cimex lectularius TaxID=79782 RepID=A0A8I6RXX8_CIMLE|nr:alpha-tocopherol transfer protein-like isoform X2 [Cimex lectularius]